METDAWDHRPFREWLFKQMRRRDWRQADLARALGVPAGTVGRWIHGERRPSTKSADRLADVLGVDLDVVLALVEHRPLTDEAEHDDRVSQIISLAKRVDWSKDLRFDQIEYTLRRWAESDRGTTSDQS